MSNHSFLDVADPRLLRDLRHLPHLSQYFDRPLGPNVILVPAEQQEALIEVLRAAGYPRG